MSVLYGRRNREFKFMDIKQPEKIKDTKVKRPSKLLTEYYGSIIMLLITVLIAAGFLVIKPKIDELKNLQAGIGGLGQSAQNQESYLDGLSRSVAAAQTIDPGILGKVDLALPRDPNIPGLLVQMDSAATMSGTKLTSISFDSVATKKTAGLQSVSVTLSIEAPSYSAFKELLKDLEHSLRIMDVQNLNVSSFEPGKTSFSLQFKTYYYPSGN